MNSNQNRVLSLVVMLIIALCITASCSPNTEKYAYLIENGKAKDWQMLSSSDKEGVCSLYIANEKLIGIPANDLAVCIDEKYSSYKNATSEIKYAIGWCMDDFKPAK